MKYKILSPCCRKDYYELDELHREDIKCPKCGSWYNQKNTQITMNNQANPDFFINGDIYLI